MVATKEKEQIRKNSLLIFFVKAESCDNDDAGTYTMQITCEDDNSAGGASGVLSDIITFQVTLKLNNRAPEFSSSVLDKTILLYESLTIDVPGYTDADDTDIHVFLIVD